MVGELEITNIAQQWINTIGSVVPRLLLTAVTLLLGFILGKLAGWATKQVLTRIKIDEWISVEKNKFSFSFSDVLPPIIKWVIYLLFLAQALDFLMLSIVSDFLSSVNKVIPNLVEGGLIFVAGYLIATFTKEKIISNKTVNSDLAGKTVFFMIMYATVSMALKPMITDTTLIDYSMLIALASVGLGVAIALGLGLKSAVENISSDYVQRFKEKIGRRK